MDTRESKTAWIVAGVLLVLLIVVGYLWLSASKDARTVLENGRQNISAMRDQIAEDCQGPTMDRAACQADLAELANILVEFNNNVQQASTTINASTTLP